MTSEEIYLLARELMEKHGVWGKYMFQFDNAKRRFGCCHYDRNMITMSRELSKINNEDTIRTVLLHEIAHAMIGSGHGHDLLWKRTCINIGGDGKRTYSSSRVATLRKPITLVCPKCGHTWQRFRACYGSYHGLCGKQEGTLKILHNN